MGGLKEEQSIHPLLKRKKLKRQKIDAETAANQD